jgi:hypothetical protein
MNRMQRIGWMTGWLLAGLLLLQNAALGLAASAESGNPLEGHLLQHSSGTMYVYHAGAKFALSLADLGDQVIEAIPTASASQWTALFDSTPTLAPVQPSRNPQPFPGYS